MTIGAANENTKSLLFLPPSSLFHGRDLSHKHQFGQGGGGIGISFFARV